MRLDTSGNVGIGTSLPTTKLDLFTNVTVGPISIITFSANNISSAKKDYVQFSPSIEFNTAGSEAGGYTLKVLQQGAYKNSIVASGTTSNSSNYLAFSTTNEAMRIDSSGNVLVTSAAGLGYGTGSGGTVTQATSRTTGVTLSKPTGAITMFSAAGSVVAATFTVTNTLVAATDTIILNQKSGTNLYVLLVTAVAAGSFNITFYTTGGVATDAPVINFAIIKGVTA
jgi:hypothetical protein